jgi:hypothetical protein
MKTTFITTVLLFAIFSSSFAQKDWAVALHQPDNFKSAPDGSTTFAVEFDCQILEGSVQVGDKLIYRVLILDSESQELIITLPSSGFMPSNIRYEIGSSDIYRIGSEFTAGGLTIEDSKNITVVVESYLTRNSENDDPIIDTDSTNNISTATARWLSEDDAASVQDFVEFSPLVYPNPAQDVIHVQLPSSEPANMELTDVKGNLVLSSMESVFNQQSIDVSTLPNGMYVLSIKQGQKVNRPQRIIVQH